MIPRPSRPPARIALGCLLTVLLALGCAARETLPTLSDRPLSRSEAEAADAAFQRGLDRIEAGDEEGALAEFTGVVEQYPSSRYAGLALYWRGRMLYQLGQDAAAVAALDRYLALSPRVPNREQAALVLANGRYNVEDYGGSLATVLQHMPQAPPALLPDLLGLSEDLLEQMPRAAVETAAGREPARNYLAPFYIQAARWAFAAGDTARGQMLARRVTAFGELPAPILSDARAMIASGSPTVGTRPRLGFIAPTEGRFAGVADQVRRGIELALEDVNRGAGPPVELITRPTASDADSTAAVVRSLARGERVRAILGPLISEYALPAGTAAREEGVALVSPTATDARLLEIAPDVLTVNALDGAIGHTIGTYAVLSLGRERFTILAVDNAYGRVQADAFQAAVEAAGGRVVLRQTYPEGAEEFTDLLGAAVRAGSDAVFIATKSPAEALRILNQMAFFELHGLMPLGTDAWNDEQFARQGRGFIRGYFADTFSRDPQVTRWTSFAERYAARFGEPPQNLIPAWGYDAARLALEVLTERPLPAGGGGAPRSEAYHGASALFRRTPQGVRRAVVVHRIERGEPVAVDW